MTAPLEPDELRRLLEDAATGPTTAVFDQVFRRAARARRTWLAGLVAATVVLVAAAVVVPVLVSGTTARQQVIASPQPSRPPAVAVVHADPLALVGRWQVAASGEARGTSLILGDELSLRRPCGVLQGEWRADRSGLFVADLTSGDGACFHTRKSFSAPWLTAAVGFKVEGPDRVLVNAAGDVVARLSSGAQPTGATLTSSLRAMLAAPKPLPGDLSAASPTNILGRWIVPGSRGHSPQPSYVSFNADGTWTGSDGCNDYGGRFAVGPAGELLTTSGGSTLVGCLGSMAPIWVTQARRAGFGAAQLVLLDAGGKVLGRLTRQPTGDVIGRFEQVGGPSPGPDVPLSGSIVVHLNNAKGQVVAETTATAGQFQLDLPAGHYVFIGSSRSVNSGQGCPTYKPQSVVAGQIVHVQVSCQIR